MLRVDSVSLSFGERSVLSGCYLDCRPGEVVGLLGRNGSGKSTLLKVIFGSLTAQFSHLRIDEQIVRKAYATGRVALLPQEDFLPPFLKVRDLVTVIPDDLADELPADQKVGDLSGGQQKLLSLLWLLALPATYLLLDEPFKGVAPVHVEKIQAMIADRKKTTGIIVTDHNYREILAISDRVVLLHEKSVYRIDRKDDLVRYAYIPG